jgi:tyrosyl-tRNA synthetase
MAHVIVLNEAGKMQFPVNLGGNTGPGSRPKRTGTGLFYNRRKRNMTVWEELQARGLIAQVTNEDEIKEMVNNGKATFYIGFDPTADSLHVGHFMALCLMKRLQMAGNRPIALLGGGTGMIGDPSGRTDMRQMMTKETIQHNIDCFKKQMERFIDFSDGKALMVNNADWLMDLNYVELLREVGAHFSVNRMLTAECYKQRMERGLSFLEFNYMIMQSYDFYMLFQKYGCNMQFGGDDQWSNMLGGTELIRRKLGKDAHAMTITLLLNSEGKKMGKTQSGAVWLDPNKTSPFDFYQYWRNVDDADVIKCMRLLTFLPLEEIDEMAKWEGSQLNKAKEVLAYELTNLVHGEEEAKKAQEGARALFAGGANTENMPSTELTDEDFQEGSIDLITMLVKTGLVPSRSEGRRAIEQGGVSIDGEKITDIKHTVKKEDFNEEGMVLKRGKKKFHKVCVK